MQKTIEFHLHHNRHHTTKQSEEAYSEYIMHEILDMKVQNPATRQYRQFGNYQVDLDQIVCIAQLVDFIPFIW